MPHVNNIVSRHIVASVGMSAKVFYSVLRKMSLKIQGENISIQCIYKMTMIYRTFCIDMEFKDIFQILNLQETSD